MGTSQEIPNVSGQATQSRTQPLPEQRSGSLSFSPMICPKLSLCFQKSHIPNSVSECTSGACKTWGVKETLEYPTVQDLGVRKIALDFTNNQHPPSPPNLQLIFKHAFKNKRKSHVCAKPWFLALQHTIPAYLSSSRTPAPAAASFLHRRRGLQKLRPPPRCWGGNCAKGTVAMTHASSRR